MSIPALTPKGLLPAGIHDCAFDDAAFFGRLDPQPARLELWNLFQQYIAAIQPLGVVLSIYLDGGFVTDNKRANDIDVVLEIPIPTPALGRMMNRREFDQVYVKKTYKVDVYPWYEGNADNDLRAFFQYINPKDAPRLGLQASDRKGILRVRL